MSYNNVMNATMSNQVLVVTTILSAPYLILKEGKPEVPLVGNDRYEGYIPDLMNELDGLLDIEYVLRPVPDGKHGQKTAAGDWDGMIGDLVRKAADIAAADLVVTAERAEVVEFTQPYMSVDIVMLVKTCNESCPLGDINTFEDLSQQTLVKFGAVASGEAAHFLQMSSIPVYAKMWSMISSDPSVLVNSTAEGIDRVRGLTEDGSGDHYILLTTSATAEHYIQQPPCDLQVRGHTGRRLGYVLAVPRGSPYHKRLSLAVLEVMESGRLEVLYHRWWWSSSCPVRRRPVEAMASGAASLRCAVAAVVATALMLL